MKKDKVKCGERRCEWQGTIYDILQAQNPFDSDDILTGCPRCKSINTILYVCDEDDCWTESTCGTPTEAGYRCTCLEHRP